MNRNSLYRCIALLSAGIPAAVHGQSSDSTTTTPTNEIVTLEKLTVSEMKSFSDQAIAATTPIAFTEFGKQTITEELGSRDIPLVLNSSPSVFATTDGGGAGDSRINVRGFDQRNFSILINGVPTNDMENGWLYWSNWDGIGDVTAAIQMQRGLSAVTLPTPSIGGTMNIVTDMASMRQGASIKLEAGYDAFRKATAVLSTGLLKDKFALTVGGVAKRGDETGSIRGTWTEGYGYYIGALLKLNATNRLEAFVIGAPQLHGQRSFASNIAAYDAGYARSLGYTDADLAGALKNGPVDAGLGFNPNVNSVHGYSGLQYWNGSTHARHDSSFINERENYFHKPQMNLNWYSTITEELKLATVVYYSGGYGGGSGTMYNGSSSTALPTDPSGAINWDQTIAANGSATNSRGGRKTAGQSLGILRNSVNKQGQFGAVSKLTYQLNPEIKLTTGIDWRTYHCDHFQEVRDLLGGSYYLPTAAQSSAFWADGTNTQLHLGDKVGYYYRSDVDLIGGFLQGQYDSERWHAFGTIGAARTDYKYTNYFFKDAAGKPVVLRPDTFDSEQIKGGVRYMLTKQWSVFTNAGWVTKPPSFSTAVNTYSSELPAKTDNENFKSVEAGVSWESADGKITANGNYYYTLWRNRSMNSFSSNYIYYNQGIDANYNGVELEGSYKPCRWVRLDASADVSRWTYTDNGSFYRYNESTNAIDRTGTLFINGLKVGDAPQTQTALGVTFYPVKGLSVKLQGYWYNRYWSDFDPTSRSTAGDKADSWRIPHFAVYNLHVNYRLPLKTDAVEVSTFLHVFNLFNEVYVSDATDNSSYEGVPGAPSHSAQRAEVFMGAPLTMNVGVRCSF